MKVSNVRILSITALNSLNNQGEPSTLVLGLGKDNRMYLWSYSEGGWILNAMSPEDREKWHEELRVAELHRIDQHEQEMAARAEAERAEKLATKKPRPSRAKSK